MFLLLAIKPQPFHIKLVLPLPFSLPAQKTHKFRTALSSAFCAIEELAWSTASTNESFFLYFLHKENNLQSEHSQHEVLTWKEGHSVEGSPPAVTHFDCLQGFLFVYWSVPLFICMSDQPLQIICLEGEHNIEEVFTIRNSAFRQFVREVVHDLLVWLHHWPEFFDRKLIVQRYVNPFDFIQAQKSFLFCKNFLQKIFVEHVLRRQIKLHWTKTNNSIYLWLTVVSEIADEVSFRAEPPEEFVGHMAPLLGAHELWLLLLLCVHWDKIWRINS